MSLTFGITGSISVGKSTVTRFIRETGIPVVDADIVAREVVVPGSLGLAQVVKAFGKEWLLPDGTMDRKGLGQMLSADKEKMSVMNKIMSPLILEETARQLKASHEAGNTFVGFDAALLIEMGLTEQYRPLIVVWTPLETQVKRLMARNNVTEEYARRWIGLQLSSDEKVKHADYVIKSDGTLEELKEKTLATLAIIKEKYTQDYVQ